MPTYSYACTDCDNRFDAAQAFTDDALTMCPKCSGRLRKLFGSVGVVFKGSGFYRNDSRDSPKSTVNGSGGSESAGSATDKSSSEKSSDKPAEKSTSTEKSSASAASSDKSSSGSSSSSNSAATTSN